MNDLISRQAAIAVADYTDCTGLAIEDVKKVTDEVVKGLKCLTSAQPEKRTEERTETHACDLIDRQAAIRAVNTALFPKINTAKDAEKALRELPSAQPEQQWIPVSEGLPKKDGRYQVTRHDDVTNTEFIDILWYEKNTWWNRQATGDYAVTAWMPLPEPWRGEQDENR